MPETDSEVLLRELYDDLGEHLGLEIVAGESGIDRSILNSDVQRPGLALAGFVDYFNPKGLQILGLTELTYILSLPEPQRLDQWDKYVSRHPAGIIISRELEFPPQLLTVAEKQGVCVLHSGMMTDELIHKIELYLDRKLAPSVLMHGVLLDVFAIGVLILGESGVGKSETALELLQRGHRLVSDDIVQIRHARDERLVGTSPDLTKHHIEIRGLGILNIRQLYGASAIVDEMAIDMVVQLESWREGHNYDRLGVDEEHFEILGLAVPRVLVPVRPGRNIAIIIEVGAMNQRLKNMGVNAATEFSHRLDAVLLEGSKYKP